MRIDFHKIIEDINIFKDRRMRVAMSDIRNRRRRSTWTKWHRPKKPISERQRKAIERSLNKWIEKEKRKSGDLPRKIGEQLQEARRAIHGDRRSLNQRLKDEGYVPWQKIYDEKGPEGFMDVALDIARGRFSKYKVVPLDIAMNGEEEKLSDEDKKAHVLYVKLSCGYRRRLDTLGPLVYPVFCECRDGRRYPI